MKKHQRFVEFYDIRDAAKALAEMNGKEIHGKQIVIEFSRPGGLSKKHSKFAGSFVNTRLNFVNSYSARPSRILAPPSPPSQQLPYKISGCPRVRPYHSTAQFSDKRFSCSKGNPKANGDKKTSIQNSMASLSVNGTCTEKSANVRPSSSKRNGKKSGSHVTSSSGTSKQHQQQQQIKGSRLWKGLRQSKEYDPRFLINEDAIMESNCRDCRTTVMIKNIPNKYRFSSPSLTLIF
jgi:RNA recognition motif-containing protein